MQEEGKSVMLITFILKPNAPFQRLQRNQNSWNDFCVLLYSVGGQDLTVNCYKTQNTVKRQHV